MSVDKSLLSGSTTLLLLSLLAEEDMYGYQMIATLGQRSNNVFALKAGTLYPLLHTMEQKGLIASYDQAAGAKTRKYYHLTDQGRQALAAKKAEWHTYTTAVDQVLGGAPCAAF